MVEARFEPGRRADRLPCGVQLVGVHGRDVLAALAHEELAGPSRGRVAARPVAEMDVADDAQLLERLEVPVDRGEIGTRQPAAEPVGDLLGRDRGRRRVQRLEHQPAGRGQAQALGPNRSPRHLRVVGEQWRCV